MTNAIAAFLVATVAVALSGCGKKESSSAKPQESSQQTQTTSANASPLEQILSVWREGDKAKAIQQFLETDLKSGPLFSSGSALSHRERELPGMSQTERERLLAEVHAQVNELKQLAAAVREKGQAVASTNPALAWRCFAKLDELGAALDQPESLKIVQLVGQAIRKMAAAESAKLSGAK